MPFMPGALTDRIVSGYTRPIARFDAIVFHVAVSEAPYPSYQPGTHAHFYVRKDGTICQQIDTTFRAGTCFEGNSRVIGVETQGGVTDANNEPWTAAQVEALARLTAWVNQTHGVPLQLMADSRPQSKGVGYHRLGIDGNFGSYRFGGRVSGGELWSKARGKICPGDAKIAQIGQVIARAAELAGKPVTAPVVNPTVPKPSTNQSQEDTIMSKLPTLDWRVRKSTKQGVSHARFQALLQVMGYNIGAAGADQIPGAMSQAAARQFQIDHNCGDGRGGADLVLGSKSWESALTGKKW